LRRVESPEGCDATWECRVQHDGVMDCQILAIVAEPVKHEFQLTDTKLGVLTGPHVAVVFTALSVPIARAAARSLCTIDVDFED